MVVLPVAALQPAFASEFDRRQIVSRTTPNLCEKEMIAASARSGVPLGVLYAVGLTESGAKSGMQPYALNVAGRTVRPSSLDAAMATVQRERRQGVRLIDVGCMQINLHYHRQAFASLRDMFDPAKNVAYAAGFLKRLHRQHGTWSMAVARYHAGANNDAAQKRYVCSVIRRMIRTGFGEMTPRAAAFCR
ncbi:transglycosylase SLT domain-containing protein [Notoacmeibacter marinus]|uniref:transglycosylase SLT domain-containing protein n=1 Tax=Notoacmeibacter marinus TaxID=1876515 RepID=UPI000DF31608|nr:transglycosylase SLT domain-containing protein [Notoacmeibacter marinus]